MGKLRLFLTALGLLVVLPGFDDPIRSEVLRVLARSSYIAIDPASSAYQPGSFVHRRDFNPNLIPVTATKLGFLCTPTFSTEKVELKPIRTAVYRFFASDAVTLPTDFVKRDLLMPFTASFAESVVVRVVDQATLELSADQLKAVYSNLGPGCSESVRAGVANGNAYQISSVYELRVQYEIRYRSNQAEDIKSKIRNEVKRIGAAVSSSDGETISGEASVYGLTWNKL
ncbi:hypothetical protein [Tardiphaga sp.]|uniref:hypothetical protein n=1 Tax=Tardiphaga sp. TaxID=1926292 RepID=UPI00352AA788